MYQPGLHSILGQPGVCRQILSEEEEGEKEEKGKGRRVRRRRKERKVVNAIYLYNRVLFRYEEG